MSKFGGGGDSSNREIIDFQKAEAAKAEAKEKERQARLKYGRDVIDATFAGGTVTGPTTTATRKVWREAQAARPGFNILGGNFGGSAAVPAGWVEEEYQKPGEKKTFTGIGQDFYDKYQKTLQDFYNPNLERQFKEVKSQNIFDLARKGLLRSSVSVDRAGDLVRDKSEADAKVASEIESQVTALQGDVRNAKQKAYGLLTSTEDPTTAANAALSEVNAIQTRKPEFNAIGDMFASALNSYSTFRNAQAARGAAASVPMRSASASSGRTYQ